jgi:hypothetical protein
VEKADAAHFVELLDFTARKHQVVLHAYALAENSAELVVQTPDANLSAFLQGVQTAYARHIRHHYVQKGSIMNGRYHTKVIDTATALGLVCEHVHRYPALDRDGLKTEAQQKRFLEKYAFSSFLSTVGKEETGITDSTALLRSYGSPAKKRAEKHEQAVLNDSEAGEKEWKKAFRASPFAIGSAEFVQEIRAKHDALVAGKRVTGLKVFGKKSRGVARTKILDAAATAFGVDKADFMKHQHSSMLRPALAHLLYRFSGMTQNEIADYIGVTSAAAVSLQIKRLIEAREKDEKLDKTVLKLEKTFSAR